MYADRMFTVSYSLHGSQRPGEIIRCIDEDNYSTFSFPVGTRVTFSIDDTTTDEESRELRRVESHLGDQDDFSSSNNTTSLFSDEEDSLAEVFSEGTDDEDDWSDSEYYLASAMRS